MMKDYDGHKAFENNLRDLATFEVELGDDALIPAADVASQFASVWNAIASRKAEDNVRNTLKENLWV